MKTFLFLALTLSAPVFSHPLDLAYFDVHPDGAETSFKLTINAELAASIFNIPIAELTPLAAQSRFAQWGPLVLRGGFSRAGQSCVPSFDAGERKELAVLIAGRVRCPTREGNLTWTADYFGVRPFPETFQVLVRWNEGGQDRLVTLEKGKPTVSFDSGGSPTLISFVRMGFAHVGADPEEWRGDSGWMLPDGIDHVLFILALVLCGGTLWRLLANATGFTVGHSLTLALASTNVIHFPARWVESAIALSISYVACMALLGKNQRHGYRIAFVFGLVHGLGFATALRDLNLTGSLFWKGLVGYNLGVELGQIAIIAIALPVLAVLRQSPRVSRYATAATSAGIAISGLYWFAERAFAL